MTRAVWTALLALLLAGAFAAPASAAEILGPDDAADLAQSLAEAQEEQGVCYGWNVEGDATSVGSSTLGPGRPLVESPECSRGMVVLNAYVVYECETCDNGDQADVQIQSSLARPPTVGEIADLGFEPGDLTGDDDDKALLEMVGALPLLVAEHGQAPFVEYEPATGAEVPASDRPTNSPSSDAVRNLAVPVLLSLLLIFAGIGWYLYQRSQQSAIEAARARKAERDARRGGVTATRSAGPPAG